MAPLTGEADNHELELVIAGVADAVITRNIRDLEGEELRFANERIVRPEHFIKK